MVGLNCYDEGRRYHPNQSHEPESRAAKRLEGRHESDGLTANHGLSFERERKDAELQRERQDGTQYSAGQEQRDQLNHSE